MAATLEETVHNLMQVSLGCGTGVKEMKAAEGSGSRVKRRGSSERPPASHERLACVLSCQNYFVQEIILGDFNHRAQPKQYVFVSRE